MELPYKEGYYKVKVLVTGGAGFIGSHLVEKLLIDGHDVRVLDNFSTGRMENLKAVKESSFLSIYDVDISKFDQAEPHFQGVDWVFHLAALADIVPSIQKPMDYHKANVEGTVSVLEASRHHGIKKFMYSASSSCYGLASQLPTPETASIEPMYPYAHTKYVGEEYVLHWNRVYKLPVVSLRLFNVFGPRARTSGTYGAVFGVFLAQKLKGKPMTVVGDGTQTRDFTFVQDVVDAFIGAACSSIEGEVFNVGSGGTYSINDLVQLLGGRSSFIPKRPGEPDCTFADVTKIAQSMGWKARVPFEEGVKRMLESIEDFQDAPVWDAGSIAVETKDWFACLS